MYNATDIISLRKQIWDKHKSLDKDKQFTNKAVEEIAKSKELLEQVKFNPEFLIEMLFTIVDKNRNTVPFFLNNIQQNFLQDLNKRISDYNDNKCNNIKFLVLKGRQMGFTSFITAYQLACTIIRRNFAGSTIADCTDNTKTIFQDKAKFVYDNLPELIKPSEKFNNVKELLFDKINSSWRVATASKEIGRSKTINFLHMSEAAFFTVALSDIQASIGEALTSNAVQIYESTANGYNEFKDLWDSGKCINKFYEWWQTPEYTTNFITTEQKNIFVNNVNSKQDWIYKRCKWLKEFKNLDWEQVYWYYNKWDNYINKDKIKQEYPCTAEEAFLASGNCVFDKEIIVQRKEYLTELYKQKPPKKGYFIFNFSNPETKDRIIDKTIKFVEDKNGYITIYTDVKQSYPYVVGGDTKGEGKDRFAGTVIDNTSGDRVATLHSDLDPDTYTHQMYCLGKYYNNALIGIEINFDIYPVKELQRLMYPMLYTRQAFDTKSNEWQKKYGFKTDGNTRPMIISNQISILRDNISLFNDIEMLNECLTFVYDDKGRPDAEVGKHDDLLFSDMIAQAIRPQQRYKADIKRELPGKFYSDAELKDLGFKTTNKIVKI